MGRVKLITKKKVYSIAEQRQMFLDGCDNIEYLRKKYVKGFNVMGIDPARSITGLAIRKNGKSARRGRVKPKSWGFSRMVVIESVIKHQLKTNKDCFVGIEGYSYNSRWGREAAGELGGIIRRLLFRYKRPLLVISPLTVKAWIGASKKGNIMLEILDRYKVKIEDDNEADAFLIADITEKTLMMANYIVNSRIEDTEDVRICFKDEHYRDYPNLKNLFKYQAKGVFNLIFRSETVAIDFFRDTPPEESTKKKTV